MPNLLQISLDNESSVCHNSHSFAFSSFETILYMKLFMLELHRRGCVYMCPAKLFKLNPLKDFVRSTKIRTPFIIQQNIFFRQCRFANVK